MFTCFKAIVSEHVDNEGWGNVEVDVLKSNILCSTKLHLPPYLEHKQATEQEASQEDAVTCEAGDAQQQEAAQEAVILKMEHVILT